MSKPDLAAARAAMIAERHEKAVAGLEAQLDSLLLALKSNMPLAVPFRSAKVAIEAMLVSASDGDKMRWADLVIAVAEASAGELQAEAFALAYRLLHPLT